MLHLAGGFLNGSMLPAVALAGFTAYALYHLLLFPLLLHPLRNIPRAHWTVAYPYIGSIWILYLRYRNRNNKTTHRAHVEHGSVVRMGYNELSINCVDNGIRTIYGGGWEKHEWYPRQFAGYDVFNMFSTVHRDPHSQKKRTMANIYSKSNLQISPQVRSNSHELFRNRFLPHIQNISESGKAVDVHDMNHAFTMDFMSAYLYGIKASTNFTQDVKAKHELLNSYYSRRAYEWHSAEVSPYFRKVMKTLRIPFVPGWVARANLFIEDWNSAMCAKADEYLEEYPTGCNEDDLGAEPVVYKQFKTGIAKLRQKNPDAGREILPHIVDPDAFLNLPDGEQRMSRNELASEMLDHLGAGHETSAIALTYLYWELSKAPRLQLRLHQEVLSLQPKISWPPTSESQRQDFSLPEPRDIDALPYLQAVVMETLRLHAPIPGIEPRVSPDVAGGSTLGAFSGIPGGVRVSSMAYALHRNPEVFPEPEIFNPDRWLIKDESRLKEMHRWFWAFGSGGRMCIGSNLALQEMKLIVSAIYTNWITEIDDDEGIEEVDAYTTRPQSNQLMLRFIHR